MTWQDSALIASGAIVIAVSLLHGVLVERGMSRPIVEAMGSRRDISSAGKRLVPLLLHFSTFNWFLCGVALVVTGLSLPAAARLPVSLLVGSSILYAAIGNFWGTRGPHPGWLLLTISLALIVVGNARPA